MSYFPEVSEKNVSKASKSLKLSFQADEAQRRSRYDGYSPYPPPPPPPQPQVPYPASAQNPFESPGYSTQLPDPFAGAQDPNIQGVYPPIDRYGSPPFTQNQPSPHVDTYGSPYNPNTNLSPPRPSRTPHSESYELQDHGVVERDNDDLGDMPLLRRDTRSSAGVHFPGGLYDRTPTEEEENDSNIRYGRIPQRVPRRYKTLKKVE